MRTPEPVLRSLAMAFTLAALPLTTGAGERIPRDWRKAWREGGRHRCRNLAIRKLAP